MRVSIPGVRPPVTEVMFHFGGRPISGRPGDTVAAALIDAGELGCRELADGSVRGVFCGMGVCHECLVTVDGVPGRRACMTALQDGMRVERQPARPELPAVADEPALSDRELACDVLVVGGGPAGMAAAAAAAEAGLDVVLVDERPKLGGQYYKQPAAHRRRARARPAVPGRAPARPARAGGERPRARRGAGVGRVRTRRARRHERRRRGGRCARGGSCWPPAPTSAAWRCPAGRCPG